MSAEPQKKFNRMIWAGIALFVLAILSNLLYFLKVPAALLPWVNLTLPAVALIFLLIGLIRVFREPEVYRGKIWGSLLAVLALLLAAGSTMFFAMARKLPSSGGAPQIGQHVPDFTLPDSTGQPTSLAQLFYAPAGTPTPKAVLLVFYRGYW